METLMKAEAKEKLNGIGKQYITPFLWFDYQAEEAVNFYISVFKNSGINIVTRYGESGAAATGKKKDSVMTVAFQIEGQDFVALNGGPVFGITPVISFFVNCDSIQEMDTLWAKLSEGGKVMMELDKYPFSEKYGWVEDKFGVSWQLIIPGRAQKIEPCFMFSGDQHLKAEEAIHFYTSVFENSNILQLERYTADIGPEGAVVHSKFTLNGQEFTAMDSHEQLPYNFNPAISMVVNCKTQAEIDYYWDKLSEGGNENAQQCGWLQDKFGVSWQIVFEGWDEMLRVSDSVKSDKMMQAVFQMKKIDMKIVMDIFEQP
jgi:predicted 3-demethylubiquinone-9 3-methyltransferase (glyoxalase superfamily)